ncbi:MAG: PilN domain-containing protein [candidate division Zixibacteria bacterium]|nr:PilN domain-containing protein [candidate division Zixibacteria bacterium]
MAMIEINLLPREMRRRTGGLALPKSAMLGTAAVAVFVLGLVGLTALQTMRYSRLEASLAAAQAKVASMKDDIALVDRLTEVKKTLLQRMDVIESLDRNRAEWVGNLEDLLATIPDYLWLSGFRHDDQKPKTASKAPVDTTSLPANAYVFDGYCYTINSLANLILNMQDSPRFSNVALRKTVYTDLKGRRVYQFGVTCHLEPVDNAPAGTGDQGGPTKLGQNAPDQPGTAVSMKNQPADAGGRNP